IDEHGRSYHAASRKHGRAQVWMVPGEGHIYVNGMHFSDWFQEPHHLEIVVRPFEATGTLGKFNVWAIVDRGGPTGQSGALSVAIARAIATHDPSKDALLAELGLVKIDYRHKERKKTDKPKARKSYTW
ncbi:ribosomal protein S5 domain 2-type protein, partial [Blyttiomyces helicus]